MIVVTGGTGFVGRSVLARIVAQVGPEGVWALVHDQDTRPDPDASCRWLDDLGVAHGSGDLVSGRGLHHIPRSPSAVVHMAACADTGGAAQEVNDLGTRNLFEAVGPMATGARVVFTSSVAVSDHRDRSYGPCVESTPLQSPFTEYGRTKLAAEAFLRAASDRGGWSLSILRLGVVFGTGSRPGGLVDTVVRRSAEGHWSSRLNYPGRAAIVHVDDVAEVVARCLTMRRPPGLYYPVAAAPPIAQLFESAHEALERPYRPVRVPAPAWRIAGGLCRLSMRLEGALPRAWHNRVWQLSSLADDTLFCRSALTSEPHSSWRSFDAWLSTTMRGEIAR